MGRRSSSVEELYSRHIRGAVKLAYVLTADLQLAEDIAQDAFVRIMGRFGNLRDPDAFASYLRKTIVNLVNSHFRRKRIERIYLDRVRATGIPLEAGGYESERHPLWDRVGELPARQRIALVLHYYEDLSESQVADTMGISLTAAKSLIARGLKSLRKQTPEYTP